MAWSGLKTLAYVPLTRSNVPSDVPPPDWANQIMQRVYDDIDLTTHVDRSLRAYIHTVSSGLADIQVDVRPQETIVGTGTGGTDVAPDALEARLGNQLRALGYDGAVIVMLGGPGGGSTTGYWSRFCMSDNHGVWAGEIAHQTNLCNLPTFSISPMNFQMKTWALMTRRLASATLISQSGRSGPSDGSILRPFRCTSVIRPTTRSIRRALSNRRQREGSPPCKSAHELNLPIDVEVCGSLGAG